MLDLAGALPSQFKSCIHFEAISNRKMLQAMCQHPGAPWLDKSGGEEVSKKTHEQAEVTQLDSH